MRSLDELKVIASTEDTLQILRENREKHLKIVKEARDGYLKDAKRKLTEKLTAVAEGKVRDFSIHLRPPQDHTKEYDTVIEALEMHIEDCIELTAEQIRNFVQDKWDWSYHFFVENAAYSATAAAMNVEDLND